MRRLTVSFVLYRLAWRNVWRNQRRSCLSITIIAIAVFALLCAGGFGLYTYASLQKSAALDNGHLTISSQGYFSRQESHPMELGLNHSQALISTLSEVPGVQHILPHVDFSGLISNGQKSSVFVGTGVEPQEFVVKGSFLDIQAGSVFSVSDSQSGAKIMLGKGLARDLNLKIGDSVTLLATTTDGALNAYDYILTGIFSTGVPELDKRQLYVTLNSAQALLNTNKVSTLSVFLPNISATKPMTERLTKLLHNHAQALQITPWQERAFFYKKVKNLYDLIFGMMGGVLALVVFVALFNSMTMSVIERTREIGTLAALGCYPWEIIRGFLRESALIALLGSVIGIVLSYGLSLFLLWSDIQMPAPPGRTQGYPLMIIFSWTLAGCVTFGILCLCLFTALLSARRGVQKPITEALIHV